MTTGRHRWVWLALSGAACSSPPVVTQAPVETTIQPSGDADADALLGAGDATAERCFARADSLSCDDCVARCRTRDVDACDVVGDGLFKTDKACAATVRGLTCRLGHAPACTALAVHLLSLPKPPLTRAMELLDGSCRDGDARGCVHLARARFAENPSDGRVMPLYMRACELGRGDGCYEGGMRAAGPSQSSGLFERGCDLGHEGACLRFGLLTLPSWGLQPGSKAESILVSVCAGDSEFAGEACGRLGQSLLATDRKRALKLLERGCDRDFADSCMTVAGEHYGAAAYDLAAAAAKKAIVKQPNHWVLRYHRGLSLLNIGKPGEAIPDLIELCRLRSDWDHCSLWLFAARERSGKDGRADLKARLDGMTPVGGKKPWPAPVFRYYLGKLSETQLLAKARHKTPRIQLEQECEAYYYIAQQNLADGKKKAAKRRFEQAVKTNITDFIEFAAAKAEILLLNKP